MERKKLLKNISIILMVLVGIAIFSLNIMIVTGLLDLGGNNDVPEENKTNYNPVVKNTEALMLLIEFEGTEGLSNFVNDMQTRDIEGLLLVDSNFVTNNCSAVRTVMEQGIEIGGVYPIEPFWDMSYEDQYQIISGAKGKIENCIGEPLEIFSSKYFAYDENTIKAAEELSIEVVMARGTTGAKATIYKPEEYDVKIFSVSNVTSENWGTGSLCDYSYWAREGSPTQFANELRISLSEPKISPVSHTYIGGLKKSWNDIYLEFFDSSEIDWISVDDFLDIDVTLPFDQIPENREVQYEVPKPLVPLDEEKNVNNPCSIEDLQDVSQSEDEETSNVIYIYHNGTGPMCLDALEFFDQNGIEYNQFLTEEADFSMRLSDLKDEYPESEGVSEDYSYYPIIHYNDRVFSGFNDSIQRDLEELLK